MADLRNTDAGAEVFSAFGKRVLFVTPVTTHGSFGGTATVSRNLGALFAEAMGARICCLQGTSSKDYPRSEHGPSELSRPVSPRVRQLRFFFDWSAAAFAQRQFQQSAVRKQFKALLREERPELVVFDHVFSTWLLDLVPASTRILYIAHDDMVAYADSLLRHEPSWAKRLRFAQLRRQYRRWQETVLRRADFVFTMTPEDAVRLKREHGGLVETAPLFFDFPETARVYPDEFHSLLVTGSFDTWEKKLGLTQFMETVFAPLLERHPALPLVVAGRVPDDVRAAISRREIRIVHRPSGKEMQEVMRAASAAVVLDLQDSGLKIKTIELAAAGLPLVSWPVGLEGSHLVDGVSGLLAATPEEFQRQLERLFAEPDLRQRLGENARAIVRDDFSRAAALAGLRASALYTRQLASDAAVKR